MRLIPAGIVLLLVLPAVKANAQLKGFGFGPYAERVWTTGNSTDLYKNGFGGGFSADIKLPAKLGLTGSAGFLHLGGRTVNTENGPVRNKAINAFPLRAGLKFRPLPLLYFKMEGGSVNSNGGGGPAFLLSPGIGVRVLGIDLQGKYERWYDEAGTRFWALRAGINF
ncbi:MAG: hypothetical protein EOO09_10570 [Chitinophagaceae bacterium]|nr:MAG: hypothetical protein EOO09_10570 [Chitinophagaceae bacterium]